MELDAVRGVVAMLDSHNVAIVGMGNDPQFGRQRLGLCDQRMVSRKIDLGGTIALWQACKQRAGLQAHRTGSSVNRYAGPHHEPSKGLVDHLVPQAHA